jgi:hypothetical protein
MRVEIGVVPGIVGGKESVSSAESSSLTSVLAGLVLK